MFTSNCQAARAAWGVGWGLVVLFGLSQSAPAQFNTILFDVEIQTANSPRLRFHQFPLIAGMKPEYTWDFTANENSMRMTDFTADTDPVVVETGVSSNTLYLARASGPGAQFGDVGIGTTQPRLLLGPGGNPTVGGRNLHLKAAQGTARSIVQGKIAADTYLVQSGGAFNEKILRSRLKDGLYFMSTVPDVAAGETIPYLFCIRMNTGNVGIGVPNPQYPFQVGYVGSNRGNGAHVTVGGVWTDASSRTAKQDIEQLTTVQSRQTVRALEPVTFRYKNQPDEQYVGFIAEDVPDLVATQDRKSLAPMDIVAVLTKVVQDQDLQLDEQREVTTKQKKELDDQRQLIEKQQAMLESLNARLSRLEQR